VSARWASIPGTHFGWTDCACGVPVVAVESQREQARCMECARQEITWPWFTPEGSWHPTVGYSGPGSGPRWPGPWPGAPASPDPGPFPEPVVSSQDEHALSPWPRPVLDLRARLEAHGWTCLVQYAEGWMPHATHGRPGAHPRGSVALRMRRGEQGAVAVYRAQSKGWAWDLLYVWGPARPWTKLTTLAAFEEAVA
jgi:hypothetical protein